MNFFEAFLIFFAVIGIVSLLERIADLIKRRMKDPKCALCGRRRW